MPGCRTLSDVLGARHGVQLNKDSVLARRISVWMPTLLGGSLRSLGPTPLAGTFQGNAAVATTPGLGRAVAMDGTGDWVTFNNLAPFIYPSATSLKAWFAWFKSTATDASILGCRSGASGLPIIDIQLGYDGIDNNSTGIPSVIVRGDAGGLAHIHGTVALNDGKPHLVGAMMDGTTLYLVADGRVVASGAQEVASAITPELTHVRLGMEELNGAILPMNGHIGDFTVHDTALSPGELWAMWDPRTRYDLYWRKSRSAPKNTVAGGGGLSIPVAMHNYRRRRTA